MPVAAILPYGAGMIRCRGGPKQPILPRQSGGPSAAATFQRILRNTAIGRGIGVEACIVKQVEEGYIPAQMEPGKTSITQMLRCTSNVRVFN